MRHSLEQEFYGAAPFGLESNGKYVAALYSARISDDTRTNRSCKRKKLRDQFEDKMRSAHFAIVTEKAYRHWIVELAHLNRSGGRWRHPTDMGKCEIEAFSTHLATGRKAVNHQVVVLGGEINRPR